jgi:hypothetical protein
MCPGDILDRGGEMNKKVMAALAADANGRYPVEWQEAEIVPVIGNYQFRKGLREGTIKHYREVGAGWQQFSKYHVPGIGDDVNARYLQYLAEDEE